MGGIPIELGGKGFRLLPTFSAARRIEQLGDMTIAELLEGHQAGRLKYEEAATIVAAGLEAAGEQINYEAVGNALFEHRLTAPHFRRAIADYLLALLWQPADAKKQRAAMFPDLEHGGEGASDRAT